MDDRPSGIDHSWFKYFLNTIKSALSCRNQNVVESARVVLHVIRYSKPDFSSYLRLTAVCWTKGKNALIVAVAKSLAFFWTLRYVWRRLQTICIKFGFAVSSWDQKRYLADSEVDGSDTDGSAVRCEVLYDPGPERTFMDVVFIHGLRGDKLKTWKQGVWKQIVRKPEPVVVRNREPAASVDVAWSNRFEMMATDEEIKEFTNCWPRDWLPLDCPYVRVIAISYSTDPYLWRPIWLRKPARTTMKDRGLEMISLLNDFDVGRNHITWVGHSKGGLFIKQILIHAHENEQTRRIITNTRGILFYSVPHNGSPLAKIKLPLFQRSIELQELVNDTQDIQKLQKTFHDMMDSNRQIQVKSFIETKLTLMTLIYLRIVSIQSADPGFGDLYGVPLDHRNICKPKNRNCFLYQELVNMIHSLKHSTIEETT